MVQGLATECLPSAAAPARRLVCCLVELASFVPLGKPAMKVGPATWRYAPLVMEHDLADGRVVDPFSGALDDERAVQEPFEELFDVGIRRDLAQYVLIDEP